MARPLFIGLVIAAAVFAPSAAHAQQRVRLDLSKGGDITTPAPTGTIELVVVSMLPRQDYKISVIDRIIEVPAFKPISTVATTAGATACAAVVAAANKLADQQNPPESEAAVGAAVTKIRKDEKEHKCTAETAAINEAVAKTERSLGQYTIGSGHELVVTVSRKVGEKTINWSFTLQGESRGVYLTTYGVTMVTDRDQKFFTKATGATGAGAFAIKQEQKASTWDLKAAPSVFFTWLSRENQDRDWATGPTAGFGLEGGSKPAIYAGYSATYNWNLGFVTGVAFTPESRLNGRYTVDQTVAEDLASEALHKTTVRPRWFLAVTYRFGDNPFAPKAAAESPDKAKAKK